MCKPQPPCTPLPSRIYDIKDGNGTRTYNLFAKVLKATDFGLPQARKRLFLNLVSNQVQLGTNHNNFILWPWPYLDNHKDRPQEETTALQVQVAQPIKDTPIPAQDLG